MDLNELYKEIEKAEIDLNAKRLKYIKEALVENGGSIKLKFKVIIYLLKIMTWKELKDKISLMTEEEQRQEVAVWGENMNLMKDCSLEKTDEDMYYNSEWDYTCEESELEPEDKNDPDVHKVYEAGMYYIYSN